MIQLPPDDGPQTSNKRDREDGSMAFRLMVGQDQMYLKVKLLVYVGLVMLIALAVISILLKVQRARETPSV